MKFEWVVWERIKPRNLSASLDEVIMMRLQQQQMHFGKWTVVWIHQTCDTNASYKLAMFRQTWQPHHSRTHVNCAHQRDIYDHKTTYVRPVAEAELTHNGLRPTAKAISFWATEPAARVTDPPRIRRAYIHPSIIAWHRQPVRPRPWYGTRVAFPRLIPASFRLTTDPKAVVIEHDEDSRRDGFRLHFTVIQFCW